MKQHITKQQWDELSEEQKKILWEAIHPHHPQPEYSRIHLGYLIEFLGEDLYYMRLTKFGYWDVTFHVIEDEEEGLRMKSGELCDALFAAVKYKLETKA